MKNTFGNLLQITLFGESHGAAIGCVIDGLPAGIAIDEELIKKQMEKRKAKGRISTQRHEADKVHIVSGYFNGYTTGTPVTILIENTNTRSKDYTKTRYRLRPSHADYCAEVKYNGYQDYRGGGHFSGRLTAPLVAAGAIAIQILKQKGIEIATHIENLHGICDTPFHHEESMLTQQINKLHELEFAVLDDTAAQAMHSCIEAAAEQGDSVGDVYKRQLYISKAAIYENLSISSLPSSIKIGENLKDFLDITPSSHRSSQSKTEIIGIERNESLYSTFQRIASFIMSPFYSQPLCLILSGEKGTGRKYFVEQIFSLAKKRKFLIVLNLYFIVFLWKTLL